MKWYFRIAVFLGTTVLVALKEAFMGPEGTEFLTALFGDAGIAGIFAGALAWLFGWVVGKLPKNDPTTAGSYPQR